MDSKKRKHNSDQIDFTKQNEKKTKSGGVNKYPLTLWQPPMDAPQDWQVDSLFCTELYPDADEEKDEKIYKKAKSQKKRVGNKNLDTLKPLNYYCYRIYE